jgi:hypothetical protein
MSAETSLAAWRMVCKSKHYAEVDFISDRGVQYWQEVYQCD